MADLLNSAPSTRRGWTGIPVSLRIGVLYVGARIVTTAFLLLAAHLSGPQSRFGADATISDLVLGWDAQWYWYAAVHGYPAQLPLTDGGLVAENQWAFMPLYAYLAQAVGFVFGSWGIGALLVSLVSGYLAALVLHRMLRDRLGDGAAEWAVVFFVSGPLAALFQVGYAESLFLLWLFLALRCVARRRYGRVYVLVLLMSFTRPGVLAFALFLGLDGIRRWMIRRREPLPGRDIAHIVALGALSVVGGFAWQAIATIVTGDPRAYLATELAWRRNWIADPSTSFVPFDGFAQGVEFWFGQWGVGPVAGGIVLAASAVAIAALLLFEPHVRRLGAELRLWSASYLVYLLAVFFPQSSIFRLLLPVSPLWGAVAAPRSRAWRAGVLAACLLGQWWWIYNMYALGNTFWQVP